MHPVEKVFRTKTALVVLIGIFVYSLAAIVQSIVKYRTYQTDITEHAATIDQLSRDNLQLNELLTFLHSDDAVDEYARTHLGMQKEGERAFIITEDSVTHTTRVDDVVVTEESNPRKWYRYYFEN